MKADLVITPLIRQHAVNAGFYWQQIEDSRFSILQTNKDIQHFSVLLRANLDGLHVAQQVGYEQAWAELTNWHSQGGAYAATVVTHQLNNQEATDALWLLVQDEPQQLLQGYIKGLASFPYSKVAAHIDQLDTLDSKLARLVVIEVKTLADIEIEDFQLKQLLAIGDPIITMAVCNYIAQQQKIAFKPSLLTLLHSDDPMVSYKALLALDALATDSIGPYFFSVIKRYLEKEAMIEEDSQLFYEQLEKLVRIAGLNCAHEKDHQTAAEVHALLPDYLKIIFSGFYGSTSHLSFLLKQVTNKKLSPLVFKTIAIITGVDIDDSTLMDVEDDNTLDDDFFENRQPHDRRLRFLVQGIGTPNLHAMAEAIAPFKSEDKHLLMGEEITIEHCQQLLVENRQVIRFIAAWHLQRLQKETKRIDIVKEL